MPLSLAPSNIFPVEVSGPTTSEAAASYVDYKQPKLAAQPYRGAHQPKPNPSAAPENSTRSQLQALNARVTSLKKQLGDSDPSEVAPALEQIASKITEMEKAVGGAPPSAAASKEPVVYFDSCAKFAGEASRVRDAGRLPFGNGNFKIVP